MTVKLSEGRGLTELVESHRKLYDSPLIDTAQATRIESAEAALRTASQAARILCPFTGSDHLDSDHDPI